MKIIENWSEFIAGPDFLIPWAKKIIPGALGTPGGGPLTLIRVCGAYDIYICIYIHIYRERELHLPFVPSTVQTERGRSCASPLEVEEEVVVELLLPRWALRRACIRGEFCWRGRRRRPRPRKKIKITN